MSVFHSALRLAGQVFGRKRLNILIYHQVFEQRNIMRPSEPTAVEFDWQMRLLSRYFTPLSLTEAIAALANDSLPCNGVCVTFDDGYLNNLTVAQPILAKYDIPATVYVATGFSGGTNMFNDRLLDLIGDEHYCTFNLSSVGLGKVSVDSVSHRITLAHQLIMKLKYLHFDDRLAKVDEIYRDNNATEYPAHMMTLSEVKTLQQKGIEIGAHTHDHPILKTLSHAFQNEQLIQSKALLEHNLGTPINHFAYPNGKLNDDYSVDTVGLVKEAGFASAVSTHWGISNAQSDLYQLKRFTPWDNSELKFHLRLRLNQLGLM
ncbi:polysaccharide deacetylase family protein [Thalassotalea atypica]|uniref:polysaccharide deacetylase family protein n=1 Tax=Thalassotalea atypica TaxID=2054316 RepID=UPI002572503E|nr:polysaccharide deacetylase family protein [Thalassotalea atypica]